MTGQLFFRKTNVVVGGKKIMVIIGMVGLDPGEQELNEVQCDVAGKMLTDVGFLTLTALLPGKDVSDRTRGNSPTGILQMPMWRV